jgi:hypothetical protein
MKSIVSLLWLLLLMACSFSVLTAQEINIYKNAQDIKTEIDARSNPSVAFDSATTTLNIYYTATFEESRSAITQSDIPVYGQLNNKLNPPVELINQGVYRINVGGGDFLSSKRVRLFFNEDTLMVNAPDLLDTIYIEHRANYVRARVYNERLKSDTILYDSTFFHIYALIGESVPGLIDQPDRSNYYTLQSAFLPFEQNPFLGNWIADMRFSSLPYPSMATDSTIAAIIGIMEAQRKLPMKVLPAPSSDQADQAISVQAVESSYRNPVATSTSTLLAATQSVGVKQKTERNPFEAEAIIAGLSDFIIDRAEEEFNISFMERFRNKLESTEYSELRILFPATARFFIQQLDIIQYKTLLPLAKQAFTNDMENLGVNFANMLEADTLNKLENDPTVFNIALFYEVANLAYQGMAIDTILQNTYLRLEQRQLSLFRRSNVELAQSPEARPIIDSLETAVSRLTKSVDTLSLMIGEKLYTLETAFFGLQSLADSLGRTEEAATFYQRYYEKNSVKSARFYKWRGQGKINQLERICYNLDGNRDYARLLEEQPQVDKYPLYFDNPPDSVELVAAGLDLTRKLVASNEEQNGIIQFLFDYYDFLTQTEDRVAAMRVAMDTSSQGALANRINRFKQTRTGLQTKLETEITFLKGAGARKYRQQIGALSYLKDALEEQNDASWTIKPDSTNARLALQDARKKYNEALRYIKKELEALDSATLSKSTLLPFVEQALDRPSNTIDSTQIGDPILAQIQEQATEVQLTLNELDHKFNQPLSRAKENANRFSKTVALCSNMLYCLKAPLVDSTGQLIDSSAWLTRDQYRAILRNDQSRDIYLGLIYNQLSNVAGDREISSKGVATVATQFIDIVNEAVVYSDSLDMRGSNEKLKFVDYFPFVRLSMDLLNTVITTPLVGDQILFPQLKEVPVVTDQALSLFENIYARQYGYAVYDAVELYKSITSGLTEDSTRAGLIRDNIILYGSFIANIAIAENGDDVKSALAAAALPPGSSRIKRINRTDVSINAYMGLGAGAEQLLDNTQGAGNDWAPLATLSVPIGLAYSHKFKPTSKLSYTFFVSILDLGAVTSFRIDSNNRVSSLPELSFSNIIAPGGFLLANIDNTPFTFGVGAQYGPQLRKINTLNNVDVESSAWRTMFLFSVDVPVFNLFTRKVKK